MKTKTVYMMRTTSTNGLDFRTSLTQQYKKIGTIGQELYLRTQMIHSLWKSLELRWLKKFRLQWLITKIKTSMLLPWLVKEEDD